MKVSVVIPTFNRSKKIIDILTSIDLQTYVPEEVIVVNDGSTDNTRELLNNVKDIYNFKLKILNINNKGRAGARQSGADASRYELLLFFDDDCILANNTIENHVFFHRKFSNSILTGPGLVSLNNIKNDFSKFCASYFNKIYSEQNDLTQTRQYGMNGQNFSMSREVFNKIGGFNIHLTDGEDFELSYRAYKEHGIITRFEYNVRIFNSDEKSIYEFYNRRNEAHKGTKMLLEFHPELMRISEEKWTLRAKNALHYAVLKLVRKRAVVKYLDKMSALISCLPLFLKQKLYGLIFSANYYLNISKK